MSWKTKKSTYKMKRWTLVPALVAMFLISTSIAAQAFVEVLHEDDFQAYDTQENPPGWVDTAIGSSAPAAEGLYKTWPDPLEPPGAEAKNIVFGTKQASGKPDGNTPRIGTFSTLTTKAFDARGRFEYRGRLIRTDAEAHIGLTFLSAYPERDSYYLVGTWGTKRTFGLHAYGAGTLSGNIESDVTPEADKWYRFLVRVDDRDGATHIRARFWLDGTPEPDTFAIDARDATPARLTSGRIGIWSAVRGEAYVDDLRAQSPVDHTNPVIEILESGVALQDGAKFNRNASIDIKATDDISGVESLIATLDGAPYTHLTPVTTEDWHELLVRAVDNAGNASEASRRFLVDKTPPSVIITERGAPLLPGTHFNRDVLPAIQVADLSETAASATLNGNVHELGTTVSAEGTHSLSVKVTDAVGWSTTAGPVPFVIDKTPPALAFTSHRSSQVVSSREIVLTGGSDDALTIQVNGHAAIVDPLTKTFTIPLLLAEGENIVTAVGVDRATNSGSATLKIILDTRAPELTVEVPAACTRAESIEIRGTVADPNVPRIEVHLGDTTVSATLTDRAWVAALPLGDEGRKTILVEAMDTVGHVTTRSVNLTVDRTPPVVEVSESGAPFQASVVARAPALFVRSDDDDPNVVVTATLDGNPFASGTPVAAEGSHTLRVHAKDCAGNESTTEHHFIVDLTAPRFLSFVPASGSRVGDIPAALTGTTDADVVEVRVFGTSITAPVMNGAFTLSGIAFADGINERTLEVVDRAGHTGRASYTLGIRTTKPVVEIIESGEAIVEGSVFRRVVEPRIRVLDPEVTFTATLNGAPFTSGTSVASDGAYTIAAVATDSAYGHSSSVTRSFVIDRSGPAVKIVSPANGATFDAERIDVRASATDATNVSVNGIAAAKQTDGSWLAPGVLLEFGSNALIATARDAAGNSASDSVDVTRGSAAPALVLTFPPDLYVTNRPRLDVTGRVLRPGASIAVDVPPAAAVSAAVDPAGAFRVTGAQLQEGEWTIRATASDGGKAVTATARVIADFTPPRVRILQSGQTLGDGSSFATTAVLSGEATDKGQAVSYVLTVDGVAVTSPASVTAAGGHTAVITARDAAGNESRVERTFSIGTAGASGCRLEGFDPAAGSIINSQRVELIGRSGGAAGVKVNGVPANIAAGSFCANVELPQEGANSITIVCTDAAGQPSGEPVPITLHRVTNEPSVTISAPDEDFVTGEGTVTVNGTLGNGAVSVEVNGRTAAINGSNWTAADVRLQDGVNVLVARARNSAGRIAAASRRVTFLKNPPALAISAPVPGFITGASTIDVTGTWGNVDPATIAVEGLSGAVVAEPWSDTTGRFVAAAIPLQPGDNIIRISGRDRIGRLARAEVSVRFGAALPVITIAEPQDNRYFAASHGSTFRVSGTFSGAAAGSSVDLNGVSATVDGTAKTFAADVAFSTLPGGLTPAVARLTQPGGGESAFDSVRVFRLTDAPKVMETFPAADAFEVDPGSVVLVLFSAPMDRASTAAAFTLENANGTAVSGKAVLDKDVLTFAPATPLTPGERYTIRVAATAKDLAGQPLAAGVAHNFVVATTAPTSAPTLTTASGRICAQLIEVAGTSAPGARVRLDYGKIFFVATASSTGAFSYKVPLSGQQGFHIVRVRTIGADGSLSPAAELKLNVDCAAPRVQSAGYDRLLNRLTITFTQDVKPESLTTGASGTIQLVLNDGTVVGGAISASAANVSVTPSPTLAEATFTLKVTTGVEDIQGRRLEFPHTQLFALGEDEPQPGDGSGFITGEVYDATTGRPLAGAEIAIEVPTAAFSRGIGVNAVTTQTVTMVTDARGRYGERFPEGAHTIRASANGYTTVWRQIIVPAGAGVIPIDIRLTRQGQTGSVASGALTLAHGGDNAVTRRGELSMPAGAVSSGTAVTLTSTGAQSLAGLLPLGWSPMASAVITTQASTLPGATLTFDVPQSDIVAAAQTLSAVRYDPARDEWRVITPVVNVSNDRASFDVSAPGAYALVYPDRRPGLIAPQPPSMGAPLQGVADPCAPILNSQSATLSSSQPCPAMVAKSFPLDPPIVLPTGSAVATLNIEGTSTHIYPSGTAVQAYIDEELRLADGGRELDPPFATDLLLYRDLTGNTGVASFNLSPSPRAAEVFLEVGFDHIRILPYPGRLDRGTLVGPEGGRVPADEKVAVEIPTGATPVELRATASSLSDPQSFGPIAGFTIVGGLQLTLQHVAHSGGGEGAVPAPVELTSPARATFTVDPGIGTPEAQLLLIEVLDQSPFGNRLFRLAAEMTPLDPSRWTTKAIDRAVLPVDGIIREGRYLLVAPQAPIAFAKGLVRSGASGTAASNARLITPGLGVADLSRLTGIFALPVASAPAAPFTLIPRTVAQGDGTAYQHPSAPAKGAVVNVGDVTVIAQPPAVVSTLPAANATDVSVGTIVQVTFSRDIDPASASITVGGVSGVTSVSGPVVTWKLPAGEFLEPNTRYTVVVSPATRGINGAALNAPHAFFFTTVTRITDSQIDAAKIRITIPDANGHSRIIGGPGALPANWLAVAVRRGIDFAPNPQATGASDRSFAIDINQRVALTDVIDLRVLNDNGALAAIIPLTPFVSEDRRAFVASSGAVTFTSADGIGVAVPAGAFDEPTVIRVEPAQQAVFSGVPRLNDELRMSAAVTLTFDGRARRPLDLRLPVLAGSDLTRPHFLGILGQSSRGPRIMAVDPLYASDGALTTVRSSPSSATAHRFATNAQSFQSNDPGDYTQGVIEAGQYAALDMRDVAGSQGMVWAFMDGLTAVVELVFDTLHSMYVDETYIAESRGRVAFPIPSGVQFTVTGIDPATSLIAFDQAYAALPMGDPGLGTVIPNPATDFSGPHPVHGSPFRIETVSAPPTGVVHEAVTGLRLTLSGEGNLLIEATAPLLPDAKVSLLHVPSGTLAVVPATVTGVKKGDELVVMIEEKAIDPGAPLSIVFNEGIDLGTTDVDNARAISDYLKTLLKLESVPSSGGAPVDLLQLASLRLDSGHRRVTFRLPSPLPAGSEVRLTLDGEIQDRSGNGLGLGQAGKPASGGSGVTPIGEKRDIVLRFFTRKPVGTISQFDIRQSSSSSTGQIRELARYDNLMFMAALDGGILAYDLSDPAALDDSLETRPTPLAQVPAGVTDYWAVQVDHHGRLFSTGTTSLFGVLRTFRVEDFVGAKADPNDDCMPSVDNAVCRIVGATSVSQVPGSSTTLGVGSALVVADRVEAIPRKLKVVVADDKPQTYARQTLIDAFAGGAATPLDAGAGSAGLVVFDPKIPATSDSYRLQRITIENSTLGLRWSADAKGQSGSAALAPAEFRNVIAGPKDVLTVWHNRTTHAVISLFGYGIGIYDVNAVESNDYAHQVAGAERPREEVASASGLSDLGLPPESIGDIRYSPDSEILAVPGQALRAYALDSRKGVVELQVPLPSSLVRGGELLFTSGNARFDALKTAVLATYPGAIARFNSSALYRATNGSSYVLLPALQYGLLVAEVGSKAFDVNSFADAVWLPDGAYAVRVMDGNLAVIIDGRGYAHLLDLSLIDERANAATPAELFPTAAASVAANALDPRILWTSDAPVAEGSGFIPPIVDPDTGMMYTADLLGRRVRVGSVRDPKIRVVGQ